MSSYCKRIRERSTLRFICGLIVRIRSFWKIRRKVVRMRKLGAMVGSPIGICPSVIVPASPNLKIGNHVSIHTDQIDVRAPIEIGDYVIIGSDVRIITCSHDINDKDFSLKVYGLKIEDYAWIATGALILPSCRHIGRGAVIGAGAVVVKDVPDMAVVSGNPATILKYRECVHEDLVPEAFFGGDLIQYVAARRNK